MLYFTKYRAMEDATVTSYTSYALQVIKNTAGNTRHQAIDAGDKDTAHTARRSQAPDKKRTDNSLHFSCNKRTPIPTTSVTAEQESGIRRNLMENLQVESALQSGNSRSGRLQLQSGMHSFDAACYTTTSCIMLCL